VAPLLTAKAHCPSNGHKLFKLWWQPNFASKRCSNLFFKGFSRWEIFLDFCKKQKKVLEKILACKGVLKIQICSGKNQKSRKKSRKAKW